MTLKNQRHRTAITRASLSRPVALALDDRILVPGYEFLDYGCGHGDDVRRVRDQGIPATGWDPMFAPDGELRAADVVNLGYVVNVIEDPEERRETLRSAWSLTRRVLVVAARPEWESRGLAGRRHLDGWITAKGTFQKFFGQEELRTWIDATLTVQSVAAAPGIFYVFRTEQDAQAFRLRQVRPSAPRARASDELFETHRAVLEGLARFMMERGRLPDPSELPEGPAIVEAFGSVRTAFRVLRRITGEDRWEVARRTAEQNLLVYLALAAFRGRPRMSDLPEDLRRDIRALFRSYRSAVAHADRLLFAAGSADAVNAAVAGSPVGKILPDAFYVHASALSDLSPVLRVYEGCARVLLGAVQEVTVLKLSRTERKVSYLFYPAFDSNPHPPLAVSLRVDLRSFDVKRTDFRKSRNPPVLHRKETLVPENYPGYAKFARLSAQEERAGLLGSTSIGTVEGWQRTLAEAGLALRGHRLVRLHSPT